MISSYLIEFFTVIFGEFLPNFQNNAVGFLSALIAYIPLHLILKPLFGEKMSFVLVAYLALVVISLTNVFVGC